MLKSTSDVLIRIDEVEQVLSYCDGCDCDEHDHCPFAINRRALRAELSMLRAEFNAECNHSEFDALVRDQYSSPAAVPAALRMAEMIDESIPF